MNTRSKTSRSGVSRRLEPGTALRLGRLRGELRLTDGRLWLTGGGRTGDWLLSSGERLWIDAGDDVVIEPYDAGAAAVFELVAPRRLVVLGAFDTALRRAATGLALGLARVFATLARSAASGARRAQGRIA